MKTYRAISLAAALAACSGLAASAAAQGRPAKGHYEEEHHFKLRLSVNAPNEQFNNRWWWETYVFEYHKVPPEVCAPPPRRTSGVDEWLNAGNGVHVDNGLPCVPQTFSRTQAVSAADAQGNIVGSVKVDGKAVPGVGAAIQSAEASSFSKLRIQKETLDAKGNIKWRSGWYLAGSVRAGATSRSHGRSHDPIQIGFTDLDTGEERTSLLFDSEISLTSDGWSTWDPVERMIRISAPASGSFHVVMDSPYITSGTGAMRLTFEEGFVIESEDWGVFDSLLPVAVGDSAADIQIPWDYPDGEIDIQFDFGFGPNVNGFLCTADLTNDGEAGFEFVPSPAGALCLAAAGCVLAIVRRR